MKTLIILLFPILAFALSDVDRQGIVNQNLLDPWNGGFENGKAGWTIGTDTISVDTSTPLTGKASLTWDSGGASRILASKAVTIPRGLYGRNGMAQCKVVVASGTATHTISVYDGTNTLVSSTITSSTVPTFTPVNFIFGSSGTIQIRITSVAADEPSIEIDDCYIGEASNLINVSQAVLVAAGYIEGTTNCGDGWTRASATPGSFATDTHCPGPTVVTNVGPGTLQTTDTDLPKFTVNSLPPGVYEVTITAEVHSSLAAGNRVSLNINDGTTTSGASTFLSSGGTASGGAMTAIGVFSYTDTANRTFELYGSSTAAATITLFNEVSTATRVQFVLKRFPLSSELAYRPDVGPASWSGYHTSASGNCNFARTNASFGAFTADADCNLTERTNVNFGTVVSEDSAGSELPGITFTPKRAGRYFVCASGSYNTASSTNSGLRLTDGTTTLNDFVFDTIAGTVYPFTLCGVYSATSTTAVTMRVYGRASTGAVTIYGSTTVDATLNWSIFALDQSYPTPILVGGVTVGSNSTSAYREEFGIAYTTNEATACSASPCAIRASNGVSSVTRAGTGDYTINFSPAFGAAPICVIDPSSGLRLTTIGSLTTTSARVTSFTGTIAAPTATDVSFTFRCIGAR